MRRIVVGVVVAEEPDLAGEICDYASTEPYFMPWARPGAPLRINHWRRVVGRVLAALSADRARRIRIAAEIDDESEWANLLAGAYTGLSQGGRYVQRWTDEATGLVRYTAEPYEISLVDKPCLPCATLSIARPADLAAFGLA